MENAMTEPTDDRRGARRRRQLEEHGIVATRVRPGLDVRLVDVSEAGALVETDRRLLPGQPIELQLETPRHRAAVRGRVVRCAVSRLRSTAICYRGAISFDRHLPWFAEDDGVGYSIPGAESRASAADWAPHTRSGR